MTSVITAWGCGVVETNFDYTSNRRDHQLVCWSMVCEVYIECMARRCAGEPARGCGVVEINSDHISNMRDYQLECLGRVCEVYTEKKGWDLENESPPRAADRERRLPRENT